MASIDFGLGAGPRLKFVVFPLNALMLIVNFASGKAAPAEKAAEAEAEAGFKDIL